MRRWFSPFRGLIFGHKENGNKKCCYDGSSKFDPSCTAVRIVEYERLIRPDVHTALQFGKDHCYEVLIRKGGSKAPRAEAPAVGTVGHSGFTLRSTGTSGTVAEIVENINPASRRAIRARAKTVLAEASEQPEPELVQREYTQTMDRLHRRYSTNMLGRREPERAWRLGVPPSPSSKMRVRRVYEVGFVRPENVERAHELIKQMMAAPIKYSFLWNNCVQVNNDMVDVLAGAGLLVKNARNYRRLQRLNFFNCGWDEKRRARHTEGKGMLDKRAFIKLGKRMMATEEGMMNDEVTGTKDE